MGHFHCICQFIFLSLVCSLGCQKELSGDDKALATVTGVIDGTGSFGAAVGQVSFDNNLKRNSHTQNKFFKVLEIFFYVLD